MAAREDLSVCVPMCSRLASGYKLACLVESAGRRGGANACEDLTSVSVSKRHLRGRITCEEQDKMVNA